MRHVRFLVTLAVVTATAALFAAGALAQAPAGQGYGGQAGAPLGGVAEQQTGGAGGVAGQQIGSLPFTGVDLALLFAGGIALALVGAGLVRAGARR